MFFPNVSFLVFVSWVESKQAERQNDGGRNRTYREEKKEMERGMERKVKSEEIETERYGERRER